VTEVAALTGMVQQQQQVNQEQDKSRTIEEKFNKLKDVYQKLREEHIGLLRKKAEVDKQLAGSNITRDEAIRSRDSMEKKLEEMLTDITEAKAGDVRRKRRRLSSCSWRRRTCWWTPGSSYLMPSRINTI
jgi:hypothetical protein